MEGLSSPQGTGAWRLRRWAIPIAVVVGAFAVLFSVDLPTRTVGIVIGSSLVLAGLIIAAHFFARARRSSGVRRRAWLCFGAAALLATLSNLSLLITGYRGDRVSVGDVALVLGLAFGVVGIAAFPLARRRGTDLARMMLDGVVFGGSILFIVSVTLSPHLLDAGQVAPAGLVVPVTDVVLATVALLLMLRGATPDRPILGLTALGFCCIAVSDFAYAITIGQTGMFSFGAVTDLGWIAGYTVIAVAVRLHDSTPVAKPPQARELSPILGTSIMFGLFITAAAIGLVNVHRATLSTTSALVWFIVLIGVFARQILLVIDNESLRRIQERRVIDRGRSLRQMAQQSDLLVNSVDDGIYGVDRDGLVTFVNPAAARILGFVPQELVGMEAHAKFHSPSAAELPNSPTDCYVNEAIRERIVANSESDRYLRADGLRVPVEFTASPLIVDDETIGAVVVFRDITQRHEIDRLKSEFVSMVSHELRTPLTAIRGSLGLIAGGALGEVTPATKRMVDIAMVSCERLTRLIDDILDMERMESGVIPLELGTHGARDLVDSAVAQLQVLAHDAQVPIIIQQVQGQVHADADRVDQTLLNLIGNAIKFSPAESPVEISSAHRGAFVEFKVSDHGRGIPEDKLDTVFARFHQIDSSDARDKGGSGLGLAISRSLVERQGGHIWATNNEHGGSTFHFTLPVSVEQEDFAPVMTEIDLDDRPAISQRTPMMGR